MDSQGRQHLTLRPPLKQALDLVFEKECAINPLASGKIWQIQPVSGMPRREVITFDILSENMIQMNATAVAAAESSGYVWSRFDEHGERLTADQSIEGFNNSCLTIVARFGVWYLPRHSVLACFAQ